MGNCTMNVVSRDQEEDRYQTEYDTNIFDMKKPQASNFNIITRVEITIKFVSLNNFFNLIQSIVICRYIGVVHFLESNHDRVASLGVLHNKEKSVKQELSYQWIMRKKLKGLVEI